MPVLNAQLEVLGSNPEVTDWLEEERNQNQIVQFKKGSYEPCSERRGSWLNE